jgi:hypothetical protein
MSQVQIFLRRFGWSGFVRLFFYPLTVLVTTPVRLVQTLWACRILADGRWENYNRFTARNGINSLCYWVFAINLYRYGRGGKSPYVGSGDYQLSKWFVFSLPSLFAYWRLAPLVPLAGMFGWWQAHAMWQEKVDDWWVVLIMGLALISTTFYTNTFVHQNYNVLGWLFFPLGLYGLANERWLIAGLAWLSASFASSTVVFVAATLSLVVAVYSLSFAPLFAILPASLKLLTHFWPNFVSGDLKESALRVVKSTGMAERGAKYKRTKSKKPGLGGIYYLLIYGQFVVVTYLLTGEFSVLFITGLILFLLNSTCVRFADVQSVEMLIISLATMVVIQNVNPWLLPSYWILISPLPLLMNLPAGNQVLDVVPKYAPFSIKRLVEGMELFLKPVRRGQRVLMAFDNPGGVYEKLFDGYSTLLQLPLYVAAKNEIHFMPEWWGVFELNYEGAPEFWGRDVDSVRENVKYWNADYVVIYQEAGTELEPKWQEAGFEALGKFSWADYAEDLRGERPYSGATPDWWLLRKP